jgi:hypothetical protein
MIVPFAGAIGPAIKNNGYGEHQGACTEGGGRLDDFDTRILPGL